MKLRQYIAIFLFASIVAWAACALVLLNMDPVTGGIPTIILFYVTLFAASSGTLTTFGTLLRAKNDLNEAVTTSIRQAALLSALLTLSLILSRHSVLVWWTLCLLILLITLIEFLWLNLNAQGKTPPTTA